MVNVLYTKSFDTMAMQTVQAQISCHLGPWLYGILIDMIHTYNTAF